MLDPGTNRVWTGYFTSRPAFKAHEREANALLQAARQVVAMAGVGVGAEIAALSELDMALGIAQHHDAITGTSTKLVDADYHLMLS